MATVNKFDDSIIEAFFKKIDWRYLKDSDGDYLVNFAYADDTKCEIKLYIIKVGDKKEILKVQIYSDLRIPKHELGAALFFCNQWNKDKRWPTAFVNFNENESHGTIICEQHIDLEQGIHQELFDDFVRARFAAGNFFWETVAKEKPFSAIR